MTKADLLKYIDERLTQRSDGNIGLLMVRQYVADNMKTGKWIEEVGMLMCSECGDAWATEQFDEVMSFNFCPNCGAEMKGEEE